MTEDFTPCDPKKMAKLPIVNIDTPNLKYGDKELAHLKELIVVEFHNIEQPGLMQSFTYGDNLNKAKFSFFHGGKYQVPRHVANHINRCGTPMYKYAPNGEGATVKKFNGRKNRFMMQQSF